AAQLEEVVVDADRFRFEDLSRDVRDQSFERRAGTLRSRAIDDFLDPPRDEQIPVAVEPSEIAGSQPRTHERLAVAPFIAAHHVRATDRDLAFGPLGTASPAAPDMGDG